MSELSGETNTRGRNHLASIIRKPLKAFGSFVKRTVRKCFGCRKGAFEGEVVIREDINDALPLHTITNGNGTVEDNTERQVSQVPKTVSGSSSSDSGSQVPSSESATTNSVELTKSLPQSRDSSAHSERSSPIGIVQETSNACATPGGGTIEARDEEKVIYSHRKPMEEAEADESHQDSNPEMGTDYSSDCCSNSPTPSTYTTDSWSDEASSKNPTEEDKNTSDSERSAANESELRDAAGGVLEERERISRLFESDRSGESENSQSGNVHIVDPTYIERCVHDESESSVLRNRAVCDGGEQSLRSSTDHALQYLRSANREGANEMIHDTLLSESQSESSESSDESYRVSDEGESVELRDTISPRAEAEEDDEHCTSPSTMNSLGTVNESDEISLNAEQMEKVCGQESYDYEKEKRAEGPVAKTEEGSAAEHADAQCSDRNSCKGNSDNYVVLSDGIHSDAGSPRETITGEDREEASSADCTGDYDSSNMNSSSPPSAARGGSETESTAASADDPETDSDELTISEQSDDSSGSRGAVSNEPGHTAGSSPSPHSSRNSTNHSGTNPGDDLEVEDETDGAHEECGTSLDTSQDEGSIVGQVLSTIRSVLASFRRRATGSSDEAMDRLSSEPSSGSDQHAREDGSISDDTEESSRSSHTESSSAIISGSQGEDEREYGAGSEPTTQSPAASDGLHEIHDTETSDLDVPLSSVAVEDRSMDDGEVRDSQDFNSSTDGEEGSDESSVIEDSDHSSQVISSSTVDDETDSDEMDLLSGSGSQYSA